MWGAVTHPDDVTPTSTELGHACCCCITCQWSCTSTYCCPPPTPRLPQSLSQVCVLTLQNEINKCLHHVLFPPFAFSLFLSFPTICPLFISTIFPLVLHFLPHLSQFSLLPGLHATKEDKVVSIFFFLCSLCAVTVMFVKPLAVFESRAWDLSCVFTALWLLLSKGEVSFSSMLARLIIPKLKGKGLKKK